ncbi:A24 family peptidase [Vibrio comitans]
MNNQIVFWCLLILISISDIKNHKIPNLLLLLLFAFQILQIVNLGYSFLGFLAGGLVMFVASFILYMLRVMSPGDVKLLGVVGFCVGFDNILGSTIWIILSSGLVGITFMAYNFSFLGISNPLLLMTELKLFVRTNTQDRHLNPWRYGEKLTMPFAPSVTIGLALFYYFN